MEYFSTNVILQFFHFIQTLSRAYRMLLKLVKFVICLKNFKVFTQKPKYQNFMMAKRNEIQEINFFNNSFTQQKKHAKTVEENLVVMCECKS
jgi:hypothetical protein